MIAVPNVPVDGPVAVTVGEALATTVSDIPEPQVLVAVALLASPAVAGVPPVVTSGSRRVAGRRVVGGVAGDRRGSDRRATRSQLVGAGTGGRRP